MVYQNRYMKNKNTSEKIIYVTPLLSSFVRNDISILSDEFEVITNVYNWKDKYLTPLNMIRQFFFLLFHLYSTKAVIVTFGGYWSFFPSLLGKVFNVNVFIILNGTDCASIPSINYGALRKRFVRYACKKSYEWATLLLPVSHSLHYIQNKYFTDDEESYQGYAHFFPEVKTKYSVLSNGLDEVFWKPDDAVSKDIHSFMTVLSPGQFMGKGVDLILEVAKEFPKHTFYIAGVDQPFHLSDLSENVQFLGRLSAAELRDYYNKVQFYFQLSIFEGFGCSLCEAMLCRCIPIGSAVNVIPEIIGETGYVLKKKDVNLLKELIVSAIEKGNYEELGIQARQRVIDNYTLDMRKNALLNLIGGK